MTVIGCVDLGNLTNYLFFFGDAHVDANWQGASKGFVGDVAVNGLVASERTSGFVPYAGTIFTNDTTLGAWQSIVDANASQAFASTGQTALIAGLELDKQNAFAQIDSLPATPGFESVDVSALNGLDFSNGVCDCIVINVTSWPSGGISTPINISGDSCDTIILRWDQDANPANGYQGQVKFQSGGGIIPGGGLIPSNFINVAGDIGSSGGGTSPLPPYPQGPRYDNGTGQLIAGGADFNGGGFFTGYWLTTGDPVTGETSSLSNAIFVGGWYTNTTKFSMTSGTSGVYVAPPPEADIFIVKSTANCYESAKLLTYTLQVGNLGPAAAENIVLTDSVPAILLGVEFSTNGGLTWNPWAGSLTIGTLSAGTSVTVLIRGTVNPSATDSISNSATVTSTTIDPNPVNNTSTVFVNPCVAPSCQETVHETVCVQADITITPIVTVGEIETFCVDPLVIGACPGSISPTNTCTFTVSQSVCVQIPLTFGANATVVPAGIVCGTPDLAPC